jgi:hypothetical protein
VVSESGASDSKLGVFMCVWIVVDEVALELGFHRVSQVVTIPPLHHAV